jgi:glycosyltransferase involved in cell wall biosynthesis
LTEEKCVRLLHILATGQMRGAETFAGDLVRALEHREIEQRALILRGGRQVDLGRVPILQLGAPEGGIPGLRISPSATRRLRSVLAGWSADVILAHGGDAMKYSVIALGQQRTPIVYRRIGLSPAWLRQWPRRRLYQILMRRASKVVAVARAVREESIDRFGMSPDDVVMVPNAADPGRLAPTLGRVATRRSLGIPAVAPVVLSVGALTWEKDPFNHLDVGSRVLAAVPDAIHIFVGDGPMGEAMRRRVARNGSQARTMFLGSRADMGDVLAAADVVLFASRSDGMEGMPAVVIEGGMSGLPVAGVAVAGVSEVVVDGQTGLLAPPGNTELLARHLERLVVDPDLRARLGAAAATRCRALFSIGAIAPQYLDIFAEVAGQAGEPLHARHN